MHGVSVMVTASCYLFCFFNDTATTEIYTRSLVGSVKMCIRDRVLPLAVFDPTQSNSLRAIVDSTFRVASRVRDRMSVSYTHLRAHETVLDLVCRLLLEKKKQRNTYSHTRKNTQT